jgi:glycine cleavage system H protein
MEPWMSDPAYPEDRQYTAEHEWVLIDGNVARVGITHFAQEALGDIVFVTLPGDGDQVETGQACGEVESTKSVSEIYSPVSGTVVALNDELDLAPELVNTDPYGAGWMFEVHLRADAPPEDLLSAQEYGDLAG